MIILQKKIIEMNIFILSSIFILIFNIYFYNNELTLLNISSILITGFFFITEFNEMKSNKIGILRYFFYLILFVRYMLIPLINIYLGDINEIAIYKEKKESLILGIILYYIEMLSVFITIKILEIRKLKYKRIKIIDSIKLVKIFVILCILLFLCVLLKHKEVIFDNISCVLFQKKLGNGTIEYLNKKSNYSIIIFDYFRILFIAIVTEKYFFKYKKTFKNRYKILNYSILILNIFIINGFSRQSILIYLVINFGIVRWIYDDKKMFKILLLISVLVIILTTFIKMSAVNEGFLEYIKKFTLNLAISLEVYFGGIKNILKANEVRNLLENYNKLFILKNDSFAYFPLLTKFSNYAETTIVYFNYSIYNHFKYQDQIVPLVLQSYIYFGIFFSNLFSILYTVIILTLDRLSLKSENILEFVIIIYLGFPISIFMMTNNTIVLGALGLRLGMLIILAVIILLKKIKGVEKN